MGSRWRSSRIRKGELPARAPSCAHTDLLRPRRTPSILLGDRSKIRQIIGTVVGNAVKYTETGGISIRFGEIPDDDPKEGETVNLVDRKDSIRISITM